MTTLDAAPAPTKSGPHPSWTEAPAGGDVPGGAVRRPADPGAGSRPSPSPGARASWLDRRRAGCRLLLRELPRRHGRVPPVLHPRRVQAKRPLRIALAIAGSLSLQGSVLDWVGDHRRHHAFSDKEGDPHSPWLYGTGPMALVKGFWHAHLGWLFQRDLTNMKRFAPDLLEDRDIARVDKAFPLIVVASLLGPALLGGLITMSWWGALTALFWAGFVRVAVLHHVTWSINSICHIWGERPFAARDQVRQRLVAGRAVLRRVLAQPAPRRPDLRPARREEGQIDISAVVIRGFEKAGWATNVRWPTTRRLERLAAK
ncbi:hypothetical protein L7F22_047186 [Adiantum nelumboides]|nr:hypothetical protein [Adiantum nelumboides]